MDDPLGDDERVLDGYASALRRPFGKKGPSAITSPGRHFADVKLPIEATRQSNGV